MKIAVLLSGGVDSSVALKLLKEQGHELTAFYLKIWLEDELSFLGECPWEQDLEYVRSICAQEGVPLQVLSLQDEYHKEVVSYTLEEIKAGRTPNPDMLCNRRIKFGLALDKIGKEYDKIATGHYAQVIHSENCTRLLRTPDAVKDQTYFLAYLTQEQLQKVLFPLGNYTKQEVRQLAQTYGLPTAHRKDSQGICFLGKIKFVDFIKQYLGEKPGDLIEAESGKVVGTHKGFYFYTIGQRQGLGLPGGPWYVVSKDHKNNRIYISRSYYDPHKERKMFVVDKCNWIAGSVPTKQHLTVKLRHGPGINNCTIKPLEKNKMRVTLDANDQGIAPGQFAVFYDGTECLGSGVITE